MKIKSLGPLTSILTGIVNDAEKRKIRQDKREQLKVYKTALLTAEQINEYKKKAENAEGEEIHLHTFLSATGEKNKDFIIKQIKDAERKGKISAVENAGATTGKKKSGPAKAVLFEI